MKKFSKFWLTSIPFIISISFFGFLEFFLISFGIYRDKLFINQNCKFHDEINNISRYKPNCKIIYKNWENKEPIEYIFNKFGRRDLLVDESIDYEFKIASIGDSFTFGAMVPINDIYSFYAFNQLSSSKILLHNYGVSGEQLENIINKLNLFNFSDYDFIVYGLTPNDLFDYLINEDVDSKVVNYSNKKIFNRFKKLILSTSLSRLFIINFLANDYNYYAIYMKRLPYSGYLLPELNNNWEKSIEIFEKKINELPLNVKEKLKIYLLPQKAEVASFTIGKYNDTFVKSIMKSCRNLKIDCKHSDISSLANLKKSHFTVDGHLTINGNHVVGNDLYEWSKEWKK